MTHRLVHALEAELPDGKKGAGIGVLLADPRRRTFRSMLMTVEGWVLFDIEKGETLTVQPGRSALRFPWFCPADGGGYRPGVFSPGGGASRLGAGGRMAPRSAASDSADGRSVDVLDRGGGAMEVRLYGEGQDLRKRVVIPSFNRDGLAERIEIRSSVWPSYTLRLRLIEGEAIHAGGGAGPRETQTDGTVSRG